MNESHGMDNARNLAEGLELEAEEAFRELIYRNTPDELVKKFDKLMRLIEDKLMILAELGNSLGSEKAQGVVELQFAISDSLGNADHQQAQRDGKADAQDNLKGGRLYAAFARAYVLEKQLLGIKKTDEVIIINGAPELLERLGNTNIAISNCARQTSALVAVAPGNQQKPGRAPNKIIESVDGKTPPQRFFDTYNRLKGVLKNITEKKPPQEYASKYFRLGLLLEAVLKAVDKDALAGKAFNQGFWEVLAGIENFFLNVFPTDIDKNIESLVTLLETVVKERQNAEAAATAEKRLAIQATITQMTAKNSERVDGLIKHAKETVVKEGQNAEAAATAAAKEKMLAIEATTARMTAKNLKQVGELIGHAEAAAQKIVATHQAVLAERDGALGQERNTAARLQEELKAAKCALNTLNERISTDHDMMRSYLIAQLAELKQQPEAVNEPIKGALRTAEEWLEVNKRRPKRSDPLLDFNLVIQLVQYIRNSSAVAILERDGITKYMAIMHNVRRIIILLAKDLKIHTNVKRLGLVAATVLGLAIAGPLGANVLCSGPKKSDTATPIVASGSTPGASSSGDGAGKRPKSVPAVSSAATTGASAFAIKHVKLPSAAAAKKPLSGIYMEVAEIYGEAAGRTVHEITLCEEALSVDSVSNEENFCVMASVRECVLHVLSTSEGKDTYTSFTKCIP